MNKASKESSPECQKGDFTKFVAKRPSVNKIEDRLVNFELKSSTSDSSEMGNGVPKKDMPKIDIIKRREMFEKEKTPTDRESRSSGDFTQPATILSIKERLSHLERQKEEANTSVSTNRLSGDIGSIKDRLTHLEKGTNGKSTTSQVSAKFDFPCGSIEDRLSSLQSAKNAAEVSSSGAVPVSAKTAIVVGMAKKNRPCAEAIDQVVEVEQLKIQIEKIESTGLISTVIDEPESLMTMTSIQDVVQDYVTIMQDVKDKEEYREITDEDLFGGTDIDAADEVEIDNLQQDISVSSPTATVVFHSLEINETQINSMEDVSQLQQVSGNTNGVQVIETLTILGDLLQRSSSTSIVSTTAEERIVNIKGLELKKPMLENSCNISKTNPRSVMMPQSQSESGLLVAATNNKHNHRSSHLKSSQSAFFDTNSGDRYCILLINNSQR